MTRVLLHGILALMISANLTAQPSWKPVKSFGPTETIAADPLGYFYRVQNGILIKYSTQGDSIASWSEPLQGQITRVDASDPMRILVYQPDYNTLRFLNNRLTPLSDPVFIDNLSITNTLSVASSRQGGFWILDGSTMRLSRFDHQLNRVSETAPINLTLPAGNKGTLLFESGDYLWLIVPEQEIRQFDPFGNPIRRILNTARSASPHGNEILLTYPNRITLYSDPATEEKPLLEWTKSHMLQSFMQKGYLCILTAEGVIVLTR